ncbi:MAG: helix-turn-helix transcriptional regulator [Myxococcales bacterium]|nr:helix-turn-helix transcriptional regulator [Myxococcales bacterium]
MKSYGQFCPVAQTMEILGERWTLLVVREMLAGSRRFNEVARGVPMMSRTMLSQRLRQLEDAGVVEKRPRRGASGHEYQLTEAGLELRPLIEHAGVWGQRWARREPDREQLDAGLLMWDMRRNLEPGVLPPGRTTVEFVYRGAARGQGRFWIVSTDDEIDLCLSPPGFAIDLQVRCHLRTMTQIWMGDIDIRAAIRDEALVLEGARALQRAFPKWLALNVFADVQRPRRDVTSVTRPRRASRAKDRA